MVKGLYRKKMNNKLNTIKLNFSNDNVKTNNSDNKKEEILKNEIICVYNKQKDEIDLLHDYSEAPGSVGVSN